MKFKMLLVVAAASTLNLLAPMARAADYGLQKTFWRQTTNTYLPTLNTNIAQAIDVTKFNDFALEVKVGLTNNSAGTLDIRWDTSLDGVNWSSSTNLANQGRSSGYFSVPLTNQGPVITWITNITTDSIGFWRIHSITNVSAQHITNIVIRGYVKPRRTG